MKHTTAIALLSSVALGVASAAVTTSFLMRWDPPEPSAQPPLAAGFAEDAESVLLAQLEELRERFQELQLRLAALESRSTRIVRTPTTGWLKKEDLERFKEEIRGALASARERAPSPERLHAEVKEALSTIRKAETVRKIEQFQKKNAANLDRRVSAWTKRLQLDGYQEGRMRTILAQRDKADAEVLRLWQSGADDQVVGEAKQSSHAEFQIALKNLLTPDQFEIYQQGQGRRKGQD